MNLELIKRLWGATLALVCMLAAAQAQQPPLPAQQGYLGAELRSLTRDEAQAASLPSSGGAAITKVEANSPAAAAGLKRGDILIEIDGKPVAGAARAVKAASGKAPGARINVRVLRDGRPRAGQVKLGMKPDAAATVPAGKDEPAAASKPGVHAAAEPAPAAAQAGKAEPEKSYPAVVVPQLGHAQTVRSVAFSPGGRVALSGSDDHLLKLWDVATGHEIKSFEGHRNTVKSIAFSPDGKYVLSGGQDKMLALWDVESGQGWSFPGHTEAVTAVAFSPDGKQALSASNDKTLKLWDVESGREIKCFEGHEEAVASVAFSPDGRTALSASYGRTLKLWDLASGMELKSFAGHKAMVTSVAFSPDGRLALSASWDNALRTLGHRKRARDQQLCGTQLPDQLGRLFSRWQASAIGEPGRDHPALGC